VQKYLEHDVHADISDKCEIYVLRCRIIVPLAREECFAISSSPHVEKSRSEPGEDKSMTAGVGEALVGKIAERALPKGLDLLRSWWSGKRLLLLGPSGAGKTSFWKFLESDYLRPAGDVRRTLTEKAGRNVALSIGDERRGRIQLWHPRDVPGHMGAEKHIEYVERYKPNCIVIVLDATRFDLRPGEGVSSIVWLEQFCNALETTLKYNRKVASKLERVIILINKWDQIPDKDKLEVQNRFEQRVRKVVEASLKAGPYKPGDVIIERCALVRGDNEEKTESNKTLANNALVRLAAAF
jgi:GTPase SAR1 family protein